MVHVTAQWTTAESVAVKRDSWAARLGLSALFLICGLAIFVFGVDYHTRFWTNSSGVFKVGLPAVFLIAMVAMRGERGRAYRPIALALFAASLTNVTTWYLAGPLQHWLLGLFQVPSYTPPGMALAKLADCVLRVGPIVGVVWLASNGLDSLFLRRGNLRWSLGIGMLGLTNLLATAIAVSASNGRDLDVVFASLPGWTAFALMNAFMEEIWCRGLFLKRIEPAFGAAGAIWLTTLIFAAFHLFAAYVEPASALIFGVITFTLGFAWALLMQKTNSVWGSVIFHMAADLYLLMVFGL